MNRFLVGAPETGATHRMTLVRRPPIQDVTIERPITDDDPSVSVVVPTLPGRDLAVLATLRDQTRDDFEVLVVEDSDLNISEARNAGIERATAPVVANTDDDCRVPPDWIDRIVEAFEAHPGVKLVEGGLEGYFTAPRHYLGAAIAYRRDAALAIEGFDPSFAGWREDTDFGWRMEDEYGPAACAYCPDLAVEHIGPPRTEMVDSLEHRFRARYPRRTFDLLYRPDSVAGKVAVKLVQTAYLYSPGLGLALARCNPEMEPGL